MRFEHTLDYGIINAIVQHPKVACPSLLPDGTIKPEVKDVVGRRAYLVRDSEGMILGTWIVDKFYSGFAEVHIAMLPDAWGHGDHIADEFRKWLRTHSDTHTLVAKIPQYNRTANAFALRVGMTALGSIPGPYKGGEQRKHNVYGIVL